MIRIRIRVRARIRIMIMMIPGNQGFGFRIEVRMMLKITQIIKTRTSNSIVSYLTDTGQLDI